MLYCNFCDLKFCGESVVSDIAKIYSLLSKKKEEKKVTVRQHYLKFELNKAKIANERTLSGGLP